MNGRKKPQIDAGTNGKDKKKLFFFLFLNITKSIKLNKTKDL